MSPTTRGKEDTTERLADPADYTNMGDFFHSAIAEGKAYVEAEKEYRLLQTYQKVGKAAGGLFGVLLSAGAFLMFLGFGSLALALWLGTLMDSMPLGFLAVCVLYLLTYVIVQHAARDSIRNGFMLNVLNSFYDEKD
ncbi:MAG: phage holin family protein [Flavobacteriales bacterium]|jgi:hypothetical protein|nr:phage holin family protein [Flavobacteriales bacterium]